MGQAKASIQELNLSPPHAYMVFSGTRAGCLIGKGTIRLESVPLQGGGVTGSSFICYTTMLASMVFLFKKKKEKRKREKKRKKKKTFFLAITTKRPKND